MVFGVSVGWEDMTSADSVYGKGVGFFAVVSKSSAEDRGCVELVASKFSHQTCASPIKQSPTDQFFHGRNGSISEGFFDIPEASRIDLVGKPSLLLGDFSLQLFNLCGALGLLEFLDEFIQIGFDLVDLGIRIASYHGWLPRIVSGKVAPVPLCSDVVQLSEHAPADQVNGVIVQDAVVSLVSCSQVKRFAGLAF